MRTEQEMLDLIKKIAEEDERVRAAYMHGSRAQPNAEKDKYSDYDISYVVTETGSFINDKERLNHFGDVTFAIEMYGMQNKFGKRGHDLSRRCAWIMFFADGNHIDLIIEIIEEAMNQNHIKNNPVIILLDKDGCLPEMSPYNDNDYFVTKPDEDEYAACCSGFWWTLSYVSNGIARDQLAYAKEQFNFIKFNLLSRMIEYYIGVQLNFSVSIGRDRLHRYYKKYLPADIYDLYTKIYSDSDYENFWDAVFSTCELFSKLACGVGDYFSFAYNKQEEKGMRDYLMKVKSGTL